MNFQDYSQWFTQNPIILVNGIAGTGAISILNIIQAQGFEQGPTYAANPTSPDFVSFRLIPGHTLMSNEIATYPFSNQTVAANAIITQPLELSIEMLIPATAVFDVYTKLSVMTSLKSSLDQHTALGGWYDVCTPSYIYRGCLLTNLIDASMEAFGAQVQTRWVWSFSQPLITAGEAAPAQNQDMANISSQTVVAGDPPNSDPVKTNVKKPASHINPYVTPSVKSHPAAAVPSSTNQSTQFPQYPSILGPNLDKNGYY